ncbi:MAG: hypothetical protein ACD_43C00272G0003 [uncultured bacterium]|nr:MAG: hypothetical protein ACD_43C00272G0003 [uncultured bacterium]
MNELADSLLVLVMLLASGFAWFLPLAWWLRDSRLAFKLSIPISLAVEVLVGYVFYCLGTIMWFPLWYGIVILLLNIYITVRVPLRQFTFSTWLKTITWKKLVIAFSVASVVLYVLYYDAWSTIAPGNNDTLNHFSLMQDLPQLGYLSSTYYAPGFHIIVLPLFNIVSDISLYRFVGPAFGVLTIIAIYAMLTDFIKQYVLRVLLVVVCLSPVFHQLTLQFISFFSSSLTFIYLVFFFYIITTPAQITHRLRLILIMIAGVGLSLTVPYFYVQLFPIIVLATILAFCYKKYFDKNWWHFLFMVSLGVVIFLMVAMGHVFLQTKLLHPGTGGFPEIPIANVASDDTIIITSTYNNSVASVDTTNTLPTDSTPTQSMSVEPSLYHTIESNSFFIENVLPLFNTLEELVRVKNMRSFDNVLAIGAYIWLILAVGLLVWAIITSNKTVFVLSIASIVYGVATQTGILELGYYRGRCGWYLMSLSWITSVVVVSRLYPKQKLWDRLAAVGCIVMALWAIWRPPVFYRPYYSQMLDQAAQINSDFVGQRNWFAGNWFDGIQRGLGVVFPDNQHSLLSVDALRTVDKTYNRFIFIEKKYFPIDPVLSQRALSNDAHYSQFYSQQDSLKEQYMETVRAVQSSEEFKDYSLYWEDQNVAIYFSPAQSM